MTSEEVIERAHAALALPVGVPGRVHEVLRLDRPNKRYFLVVFGDDQASVGVATVDAASGAIETTAHLDGRGTHRLIEPSDAARAARAADDGAAATLVWKPCRASRSPLYPLWKVDTARGSVFVDQQGRCWANLDASPA